MKKKIDLNEIIGALEIASSEMNSYLNTDTGEVVQLSEDDLRAAEDDTKLDANTPEWMVSVRALAKSVLEDDKNCFLTLPSQFDIHEWELMQEFSKSISNQQVATDLQNAIRGSGAFRNFRNCLNRHDITDNWYSFRKQALRKIAISWCEDNEVEYEDRS